VPLRSIANARVVVGPQVITRYNNYRAVACVVGSAMVRLSKHTTDEMEGRGILLSYIEAALTSPDRVVPDMTDPAPSRSYKVLREFGNRVLRVVHRRDGDDIFVVTAHWDRGAKL